MLPPDPFSLGEDRLACPECGTHNTLGQDRCWNCKTALTDADRIAFVPGPTPLSNDGQERSERPGG